MQFGNCIANTRYAAAASALRSVPFPREGVFHSLNKSFTFLRTSRRGLVLPLCPRQNHFEVTAVIVFRSALLTATCGMCALVLAGCGAGGSTAQAATIASSGSSGTSAASGGGSGASSTGTAGASATSGSSSTSSASGTAGNASSGSSSTPSSSTDGSGSLLPSQASVATAARLMDQATFGPTTDSITHAQMIGVSAWLKEQFATSQTVLPAIPSPYPTQCMNGPAPCWESEFWQTSLTAPDQLRQRVAFTLGEIFVTSTQSINAVAMVPYYNTLAADAFTNWRTIMEDVTLSPAMGNYLNMIQNAKPAKGQHANENFAREMMQLFSVGLYKLNLDGTQQLDTTGTPIPEYTETQVQAFADTFTGWTYATSTGGVPAKFPNGTANYTNPMVAVDSAHDTTQKTLLDGVVVSAGGTAKGDLKIALDDIFNDGSLPPFICQQLIQHLVTSTPSAGYVQRVASVFVNNGSGVRGDMQAVLTAIFTDTEARAGDTNSSYDGGHLREPMLYLTSAMRALGYSSTNTDPTNLWAYMSLSGYTASLGEQPMHSPSVFNYYEPQYVIPGTTLNAPEFGLENTASVNQRLTLANSLSTGKLNGFSVDLSKTSVLGQIGANPGKLVDTLGVLFMHGQMPSEMRTVVVNAITPLTDYGQRVRVAVYLILSSSQYKVIH